MATNFTILRGNKDNLVDEQGSCKLPPEKLVNGYWYLTNDTAEVYVALEIDGVLQLKKINECDINNDFPDLDSFEERLLALENEEKIHTYAEFDQLPTVGKKHHLYAVLDKQATYIYTDDGYICVGDIDGEEYDVIYGGSATI